MKLLIVTDIHHPLKKEELDFIQTADYDVCFSLGDIDVQNLKSISEIVSNRGKLIFGICGNHDSFQTCQQAGISNIHQEIVSINGITFTGFQGSYRYKPTPELCMYTQEESMDIFQNMSAADVLISHDSPYGLYLPGKHNGRTGLVGIKKYIETFKPKYAIHGHEHFHNMGSMNGTKIICCFRVEIIEI